jgi:hypothetical protein
MHDALRTPAKITLCFMVYELPIGGVKMFNETVNVQEAMDRLKAEVDEQVLATCLAELKKKSNGVVPVQMALDDLIELVHLASDDVHRLEIEESIYVQSLAFNSDP